MLLKTSLDPHGAAASLADKEEYGLALVEGRIPDFPDDLAILQQLLTDDIETVGTAVVLMISVWGGGGGATLSN